MNSYPRLFTLAPIKAAILIAALTITSVLTSTLLRYMEEGGAAGGAVNPIDFSLCWVGPEALVGAGLHEPSKGFHALLEARQGRLRFPPTAAAYRKLLEDEYFTDYPLYSFGGAVPLVQSSNGSAVVTRHQSSLQVGGSALANAAEWQWPLRGLQSPSEAPPSAFAVSGKWIRSPELQGATRSSLLHYYQFLANATLCMAWVPVMITSDEGKLLLLPRLLFPPMALTPFPLSLAAPLLWFPTLLFSPDSRAFLLPFLRPFHPRHLPHRLRS